MGALAKAHILVVDDDDRIRHLLARYLGQQGYRVSAAADAAAARSLLGMLRFDLAILDVMMPGESGLDLARHIRKTRELPVLMLTAMGETGDRIAGLEAGADDYLPKPFEPRELLLRIAAIMRRAAPPEKPPASARLAVGPWVFDAGARCLYDADGQAVALTNNEVALLAVLAEKPGLPVRREALAASLGLSGNDRTIDVQVTRLRRKLGDDPKLPMMVQTVRGQGYLLRARPETETAAEGGAA
ncbi:MAG: response regulator transcription factor [Rhodospirillales bacterium]|nr:response regulator transcription factor [Alphaproteobacteria bacterium]MCB9986142.1 response regulator transcription factor [Rhodospirillales bacterium]USO07299.1 MAG: response regulator transcription factor [Rhodospirillales bacterium]